MSWFSENGIEDNNIDTTGAPVKSEYQPGSGAGPQTQAAPAKAGTSWLDWIAQTYGTSKSRGGGFADLPAGTNLEQAIGRFNQETGANARYIGGQSGDQVDFGQGPTDALTAGGQLWQNPYGLGSGPAAGGGGGGGVGAPGGGGAAASAVNLPTAPTVTNLTAPAQFSYAQGVPTPGTLNYTGLETPAQFQNMTAEELAQDPSYQFRSDEQLRGLEQSAAGKGLLRTGGTYRGLLDLSGQLASQEYGAANARKLGAYQTNAQTGLAYNQNANQNALQFGQANINNALNAQQQGYNQAAGAYGLNAQTGLAYGSQNQNNQLANYQAQVNAALGLGNLNLGYQNSANSYTLGMGNLGLGQAQLGQNAYQFGVNQGNWLNTNAWNQNMDVAHLGNPGAPNSQGYGVNQGEVLGQQGNANAAGQIGAANANNQMWNNLGTLGVQAAAYAYPQYGVDPVTGLAIRRGSSPTGATTR